ncbi:hypothetical protein FRC96_03185 [Lujinxingia vulgaris]|uniref:RCC1-like domain-containing protein n=2 Tax=Lujinxingia vulgaris TaxID=2600176 RepID=A0A5C6XS97_9DELT|nr:hypothetical protein FRC96_03185 [Lujinxingia vulgaris]
MFFEVAMTRCAVALVVLFAFFLSACGGGDTDRRRNDDENACVPSCQEGFSCVAGACYVRVQPEDCGEGEEFDPTYRVCLVPSCEDTVQNGGEEGVDCGGPCDQSCEDEPVEPTCDDGVQNGDEEGEDCGGSCEQVCEDDPVEPTCEDEIQNGGEEGVDCGGPCEEACAAPTCEDEIQNGGEEGVDCGGPCEEACVIPATCGDGQVDGDEQCDHGGTVVLACAYGEMSCQVCNAQCEEVAGQVTGYCGDDVVQSDAGEACDHGGSPETECEDGEMSCQVCNAQCELIDIEVEPGCGDGVVQGGEECDHGGSPETSCAYGEMSCRVCNAQCQEVAGQVTGYCGDGVMQPAHEACDGGDLAGATCTSVGAAAGELSCDASCELDQSACLDIAIAELSSGFAHTCVRTTDGEVYCWGRNDDGRLGDGTTIYKTQPTLVPGLSNVTKISAGGYHTCAIQQGGTLVCWGGNLSGQLGNGTVADAMVPTPVLWSGTPPVVTTVSAGSTHTCAIVSGGQAYCWGSDEFGKLGSGGAAPSNSPLTLPTPVSGLADATQIHAGRYHSCARRQLSGRYVCWGRNSYGELGDADYFGSSSTSPRQVDDADYISGFLSGPYVAAGDRYSCARGTFGTIYCWGSPAYGQLGDSTTSSTSRPNEVFGGPGSADYLSVGERHVCAVGSGTVYCWGSGQYGRLGLGDTDNYFEPFALTMPSAIDVQVGGMHTCARLTDGGVMCWGRNSHGQLGDGTLVDRTTPVRVQF